MPSTGNAQNRAKEEWLREELRANRSQMISLIQWGVTILAAIELNLYYIRRDVIRHLVDQKALQPNELLSPLRWSIGTLLLVIVAYAFSHYLGRTARRHVSYRDQLISMESYSGIKEEIPTGGRIRKVHYLLFYAFPLFDVFVWCMFYVGEKLKIPVPW